MAEYIEREAAVNAIIAIMPSMSTPDGHRERDDLVLAAQEMCEDNIREINNVPAADVAPVVHGRWLPVNGHWGPKIVRRGYQCSLCGRIENQREPYCHCGARMNLRGADNNGAEKA